jgi:hypothetical protein
VSNKDEKKERKNVKLTETSENEGVSEEYFYRMLSPGALRYSEPYNDEESEILENFLKENTATKGMNFVAVGAGELWYLRFGLEYTKDYVSIEPLQEIFLNDSVKYLASHSGRVFLVNKRFSDIQNEEMPAGPSLYVFLFNILAYIDEYVKEINNVIEEGDILFISSWNNTKISKYVRRNYFDFLNSFEKQKIVDPENGTKLCDFDNFPFVKINFYKKHERIKGLVADVLIIYT